MFGKGNQKIKATQIDTLIGATSTLKGDISFTGGLHVEGRVLGNIASTSGDDRALLILNDNGVIEGNVEVPNMVINGTVKGDLNASGHVELASKAKIHGNVYYNLVEMAVGAQINGNLVHREEAAVETARPKPVIESRAKSEVESGIAKAES